MKKYSMKDIAELSGVSIATVSRVINNNGRFSEETRKKVEKVIKETDYRLNYNAKSLRMNKSFSIGILVPDITNPFFGETVQKIEKILFEKGYTTIICNTAKDADKEKSYLNILESKGVDGIIVISGTEKFDFDRFSVSEKSIPYVCIDREPHNLANTIFISSDHYQGALLATEHLMETGVKHPVIATHDRKYSFVRERLSGFKKALENHNIQSDQHKHFLLIDRTDSDFESKVLKFLKENPETDSIFAINDNIAMKLIATLKDNDVRVPEDIKIIGFDDTPYNQYSSPSLSSVKHNTDQISQLTVDSLLKLIQSPLESGDKIFTPVSLSLRESTESK